MYAISFDLSVAALEDNYQNAYGDIKKFLASHGFTRQQGSVYFGNSTVDAVKTVMAVNHMSRNFPWLRLCFLIRVQTQPRLIWIIVRRSLSF
ncbi:virulence factor [Vibrio vulnificus]|uniref:virulence factor n=1 Tax=Vibrio vulnificus TaxID=672 RepID=UPI00102A6130|nr:virulence factor [Vibrio vulnificus]RZR36261.1 virulence factor [Vibrio vulnificus]